MELFDHDKENINELLHVITDLAQYYAENNDDNDDKVFQQPIFFCKPKNSIKWVNPGLGNTNKFEFIDYDSLIRDRGLFDTDIIWYSSYILSNGYSLLFHHPLDWQLISISNGEITLENKIYVNTNKDSEMFGFYVYAPGSDDKEVFKYHIIATNNEQFKTFWSLLRRVFNKIDPKMPIENDGRDVPLKIIHKLVNQKKCLLDNYYTCSEYDCLEKKKKIFKMLENLIKIKTPNKNKNKITLTIKECGICYWVKLEIDNQLIIGGDLFYDRLENKFITKGKTEKFLKWENSFEKIINALNIEI